MIRDLASREQSSDLGEAEEEEVSTQEINCLESDVTQLVRTRCTGPVGWWGCPVWTVSKTPSTGRSGLKHYVININMFC